MEVKTLKEVAKDKLQQKQVYVDEINKYKKEVNLQKLCELININYKQFLAGYNGDFNRISIKSLSKFVDAMHEELELQEKIKSFRIYKCYFDLQSSLHQQKRDDKKITDCLSRLQYLLHSDIAGLTKEEIDFLKQECSLIEKNLKK